MTRPAVRTLAAIVVPAGCTLVAVWVAACGLRVDGIEGSNDGGADRMTSPLPDAPQGLDSPIACTTIDAACLGPLPQGWQPVAVSDAGCARGFASRPLFVNPRLPEGGCACGACQILGSLECATAVTITSGGDCNDSPPLVLATAGMCTMASAQHVDAHGPAVVSTASCFVPNDAGAGATADSLSVCLPGCQVDYCNGSQRCVAAVGDVACPSGFTLAVKAGTGVDPGCASCGCDIAPPGPCRGTVTVYDNSSCLDSGQPASYALDSCQQYSTTINFGSLLVELQPPAPECIWHTPDVGDASLTGVETICCK